METRSGCWFSREFYSWGTPPAKYQVDGAVGGGGLSPLMSYACLELGVLGWAVVVTLALTWTGLMQGIFESISGRSLSSSRW